MNCLEYQIKTVGKLKYSRLGSIIILKKEINLYGYKFSLEEIRSILDCVLNNLYDDYFDLKWKKAFDAIFEGNEYIEYEMCFNQEQNFPTNYIIPFC